MGLYTPATGGGTTTIDFSALLAKLDELNTNTTAGNTALLGAFSGIQFNQPPLTVTSPAPAKIIFTAGETKQIIPASTSPRRIIIKAIAGEIKLLLGTSANIANSAISVQGDRLIDERWSGAIFGYSEAGGEILVNIEIE
jgi:hypothetical protein